MVTQADIAKKLGLSQAAVASVVGSYSRRRMLNPVLAAKVRRVAKQMGYRPHRQAQMLRGGKSGVIAVLQTGVRGVAFSTERVIAMEEAVREAGYDALTCDVNRENARLVCDRMLDARVEGILLGVPEEWFPGRELRRLRRSNVPLATVSGVELPGVPQVCADARAGMMALTEHLIALGRRRLVLITVAKLRERIEGFQDAVLGAGGRMLKRADEPKLEMEDNADCVGIVGRVICCPLAPCGTLPCAQAEQATRGILAWRNRPDALLCTNDDWALGALAACCDAGIRVPGAMAVTGFDGTMLGAYYSPRLTTVAQPLKEMAGKAMELLARQIRGEKLAKEELRVSLPCRLMVRASCGALRTAQEFEKGDYTKGGNR